MKYDAVSFTVFADRLGISFCPEGGLFVYLLPAEFSI